MSELSYMLIELNFVCLDRLLKVFAEWVLREKRFPLLIVFFLIEFFQILLFFVMAVDAVDLALFAL